MQRHVRQEHQQHAVLEGQIAAFGHQVLGHKVGHDPEQEAHQRG